MLGAELEAILGKRPDLHVVTIADGAHDNWRYLDALAPRGTALVDFYHAAEQLKSGLDACYGEGNAKGRAHYEKLRHLLRHECGGVEKVIRSLNHERRKQPENKPDCCKNRKIRYSSDQAENRFRVSPSFPRKRESTSITKVSGFPLARE